MFNDPQSVTFDGNAVSLDRIGTSQPDRLGTFMSDDGNLTLDIRQDKTASRFRRELRLTMKKVAADPISSVNKEVSTSVIFIVDEPRWGFSDEELGKLASTVLAAAGDSTVQSKLLQGES